MSQFEAAEDTAMAERRYTYPAPWVRLKLMAAIASCYGLITEIPDASAALPEEVQRDSSYVADVAAAIVAMPRIRELAATLPFKIENYLPNEPSGAVGQVQQWSSYFAGKPPAPAARELRSARMAAAGAAKAWSETNFASKTLAVTNIRDLAIPGIAACGPLGVRSATAVAKPAGEAGQSLWLTLRKADQLVKEVRARSR